MGTVTEWILRRPTRSTKYESTSIRRGKNEGLTWPNRNQTTLAALPFLRFPPM